MQNYDQKFGNEGYGTFGRGHFIKELPVPQRLSFSDFSGGLDMRDAKEDTLQNSSSSSLDVEVTQRDRLRPVPGTTTSEVLTREAKQMLLQASLDYTSELVLFDAPFLGVKRGATTTWFDASLPVDERLFAAVNFGGALLFSNGSSGLYKRESGKDEVELVEHGPAAHTFASFAGRVFSGATIIGGNREPLGISWSGASSDPSEWDAFNEDGSQTGAGSELLIDDMVQGNYIVALRTMGLDFMAVFLRNSIWIGRRTNNLLRPADFQPRVTGVGAINESTCAVTRFGAIHVHDSGVYLFDGNISTLISEQINAELLPIDKSQLNLYRSSYDPLTKQYFLFTPVCTWVLDLERRRWHKRSLVALGASIFASQLSAKTWGELLGTWASQSGAWEDYKAQETGDVEFIYLGEEGGDVVLAKEDPDSRENFGVAMEPFWDSPQVRGASATDLICVKEIGFSYLGEGKLRFDFLDQEGDFVPVREATLRRSNNFLTDYRRLEQITSRGGFRLNFLEGNPEVSFVELQVIPAGKKRVRSPEAVVLLEDTGIDFPGFYTDFSDSTVGQLPVGWTKDWLAAAQTTAVVASMVGSTGGKILRVNYNVTNSSNEVALHWASIGTAVQSEIVTKFRISGVGSLSDFGTVIRSAAASVELAYTLQLRRFSGSTANLQARTSSTALTTLASTSFVAASGTWYWARHRANGTQIQAKFWADGDAEPAGWTFSVTNSVYAGAGSVGLFCIMLSQTDLFEVDLVGVNMLGGTAPSAPAADGWIMEVGKFNFRVSNVPTGYKLRASGVTVAETNGIVIFALPSAPASVDLLDSTSTLVGTAPGPIVENRQYLLDFYYV